jgi:hypothetical protein
MEAKRIVKFEPTKTDASGTVTFTQVPIGHFVIEVEGDAKF